jgi:hypothetical protein
MFSRRWLPYVVVAAVVLLLASWRLWLIGVGPDPDTDAYGHHMIARQVLADPRDLGVHWVWLPLFHYAQALLVALGGTMHTVRVVNDIVWAAVPLLVLRWVGAETVEGFVAAIVCAVSSIGMQMATTAQPEPLFCLFVLGFVMAMGEKRWTLAAVLLAAAAMLRYEAWAVLAATGAVLAFDRLPQRRSRKDAYGLYPGRAWITLAVPAFAILAWAALRKPWDGEWFGFLSQTRKFANDAMGTKSSLEGGASQLVTDLLYYAVRVPYRTMGLALLLVPFGMIRAARALGRLAMLAYAAAVGFLTLSWVMKSSLGLDRHFVVMVPFYSALCGYGVVQIGEWIAALFASPRARSLALPIAQASIGVGAITILWLLLGEWMHNWRGALEHGWPDRTAVGAYLRTVPERDTIYCDEATVEILSGVDRKRFDRHWVDAPDGADRIEATAAKDGEVYVATWAKKLKELRTRPGAEVVYRPPSPDARDDDGLLVVRVTRVSSRR